jgi:hypothetical protein
MREAHNLAESKACPELAEGDPYRSHQLPDPDVF